MKKRSRKILAGLLAFLVCALSLCGCGEEEMPADTDTVSFASGSFQGASSMTELTAVLQSGETELLSAFTALERADLSGSTCPAEIYDWAQAHPDVEVTYTVALPDGTVLDESVKELDLSKLSGADISALAEKLCFLPHLRTVRLGTERAGLKWEDIGRLQSACPDVKIKYDFTLYGKPMELSNTRISIRGIAVDDGGAAVTQAMTYMPQLEYVDMDSCGLSNEEMAAIRDAFPDIRVVWRVWFGKSYSVRTDVERILASKPSVAGMLDEADTEELKYCTGVRFLDIGHNQQLKDISFVRYMPKLEVAILAMNEVTDISALAACPELEYLEIQSTLVSDLTPLSGLTKLKHLNICMTEVSDISPLYSLTGLERLWIGGFLDVSPDQIMKMQQAAPDCEINATAGDPTEGHWRYKDLNEGIYNDRYTMLRYQFGYDYKDFSFSWNDPLCPDRER